MSTSSSARTRSPRIGLGVPAGPSGGLLGNEALQALAKGTLPHHLVQQLQIREGEELALGAPGRPVPAKLLDAVRVQAGARTEVLAAWVLQLTVGGKDPHLCVVLECSVGSDPERFVPALMEALQPLVPDGEYLDCLPQRSGGALIEQARRVSPPIFGRGAAESCGGA